MTVPAATPSYSKMVRPASRPEPSANSIVISGPRLCSSWKPMKRPMAAAMIGTTQMRENAGAREIFGLGRVVMVRVGFVAGPKLAWVERFGGEDCQDDGRGKGDQAASGNNRCQFAELDEPEKQRC